MAIYEAYIPLVSSGAALIRMIRDPNVPDELKHNFVEWFIWRRKMNGRASSGDYVLRRLKK